MEIANKALSLFDYIGNNDKSNSVLEGLAKGESKDIKGGLAVLDAGVANGKFEDTLKLLEKGEIDVDLKTVENYFQFNINKLNREVDQLNERFDLGTAIEVNLQDDRLVVSEQSEKAEEIQQYLDKDTRLSSLIKQTGKLSQFVEWGQAKEQAAVFKNDDVPESQLVDFLKDARKVVTNDNQFVFSGKGSGFASEGQTRILIDHFTEKTLQSIA